jgi:hypothetical protein
LKILKSQFLAEFQSFVFWQFWAEFVALTVVESMPEERLKSLKRSNSRTVSPNVAWNGSLESYHPYLQAKKVSEIPKIECNHSGLPKPQKAILAALILLGVNGKVGGLTQDEGHAIFTLQAVRKLKTPKSTSTGSRQVPKGWPLPVHSLF